MRIKYIGNVNKVMLPGIPGTFTTGAVREVSDKIGWEILKNPLFIIVDDDDELWLDDEFWLTGEKVDEDEPEEAPWQLKVQEVETPIEETPEIEEVPEEPVEETPKKSTRKRRTPKVEEPQEEIEAPEEDILTEPLEEKEKEKKE